MIFIDRDGTIIDEPPDQQVDCISKFKLKKNVIPALLALKKSWILFGDDYQSRWTGDECI